MGNERDLLKARSGTLVSSSTSTMPGKASGTEHLPPAAGPPTKSGIWGAYASQGTPCEAQPAQAGCFLPADQRARTITTYQARVTAAEGQYGIALVSVEIDERLKKHPEKHDWVADVLLDVIGMLTMSSVKTAIKMAMDHGDEASRVIEVISPILGAAKKDLTSRATAHDGGAERTVNVRFLDHLKNSAAVVYQRFREDVLAVLPGDAMLMVLFDAFRAELHSVDKYKAAIEEKLQRFETSNIGKLGISKNPDASAIDDVVRSLPTHLDRSVFWVDAPGAPRLAIYKRGHVTPEDAKYATDLDKASIGTDEVNGSAWQFETYVPQEFTDVAVSMHTSTWGAPPEHRPFGMAEMLAIGTSS